MRYKEYRPNPPLDCFIECFWTLEAGSQGTDSGPQPVLPDGCAELILNFGDRFLQHDGGDTSLQPQLFLVGQITKPIVISPTGRVELIGVRFHPGGTAGLFRVPMKELTNQVVELEAITKDLAKQITAMLDPIPSLDEKIVELQKLFKKSLDAKVDVLSLGLSKQMLASGGMISVDHLASEAGIIIRHLERKFLRDVGISPKLLSRILRFQQVFRLIERSDPSWANSPSSVATTIRPTLLKISDNLPLRLPPRCSRLRLF